MMVISRIFLFLPIIIYTPLFASEKNYSNNQGAQAQQSEIKSNSVFDYCHCGTLRTIGENKVSENLSTIWKNYDCFDQCWREQKFPLSTIRKYLGQPDWIDDRNQQCCFGSGNENTNGIAVAFVLGKFKQFWGECEEYKNEHWRHPWYRSRFWNDAILDSIVYQPAFLLNYKEREKLSTSQNVQLSKLDSNEFQSSLDHINGYYLLRVDRNLDIEIIKQEVLRMNQIALTDSTDLRPYRYFVDLYGSMSQHDELRTEVFEAWIYREPNNLDLRWEASNFYIDMYCRSWLHRGNGQWEAQDENREALIKAKTHLEFIFRQNIDHFSVAERLLLIACWMDDCVAGTTYRDIMVNYFCIEPNSDLIRRIDIWLQNCPRGFWGDQRY